MKWFNILKVLGTKSGFSQLDFDNVVIEDEDDCKRKVKKLIDRFSNLQFAGYKREQYETYTVYSKPNARLRIEHYFDDSFTEEVYCKILEVIKSPTAEATEIGYVAINKYFSDRKDVNYDKLNVKENIIVALGGGANYLVVGYQYKFVEEDEEILPKLEETFNVV